MGYYLELYSVDNSLQYNQEILVDLFCANGCNNVYNEERPDLLEVECPVVSETFCYLGIHFPETIKEPPQNYFADLRLDSYSLKEEYEAIFKSLFALADKLDFYIYDSLLNLEVNASNVGQVIEFIMLGSLKLKDLQAGVD